MAASMLYCFHIHWPRKDFKLMPKLSDWRRQKRLRARRMWRLRHTRWRRSLKQLLASRKWPRQPYPNNHRILSQRTTSSTTSLYGSRCTSVRFLYARFHYGSHPLCRKLAKTTREHRNGNEHKKKIFESKSHVSTDFHTRLINFESDIILFS